MAEIKLERKPEAAKLRVYLGAAPGVGKTFHMLNDDHAARKQGMDIVIGLVETNGRQETEEQIRDLELVPLKDFLNRGVVLKEMNLNGIIERHPKAVVVHELAHTNVPGSKNRKRYEGVLELLDAGINVWTVAVRHSVSWFGAEPLPERGEGRDGAGGSDGGAAAPGLSNSERRKREGRGPSRFCFWRACYSQKTRTLVLSSSESTSTVRSSR